MGIESPNTLRIADSRDDGEPLLRGATDQLLDAYWLIVSRVGFGAASAWLWILHSTSKATGRASFTALQMAADLIQSGKKLNSVSDKTAGNYIHALLELEVISGGPREGRANGGWEITPLSLESVESLLNGEPKQFEGDAQGELELKLETDFNSKQNLDSVSSCDSVSSLPGGERGGLCAYVSSKRSAFKVVRRRRLRRPEMWEESRRRGGEGN